VSLAESLTTVSAAGESESSAAAQLLVNAMTANVSGATNTPVKQITPSTPIVLSAEALTSLLMMNSVQQQPGQPTSSVELNAQLLQYMAEQAGVQAVTISADSANVATAAELGASSTALDLEVGAQEMVSEEGTGVQKQHPLHLN